MDTLTRLATSLCPSMGERIQTTRLDSGLTVVTETMPDVLSVTTGIWVGVGSRDEVSGRAGASHFLEHLLFKGTATRRAHDIAEQIDAVGGDMITRRRSTPPSIPGRSPKTST